jgi:DNA-binding XRE family transcriptional regulator
MSDTSNPTKTIKQVRENLGLSQLEVAYRAQVSLSTIAGIEQDRQEPRVHVALQIARALEVLVEEIAWPGTKDLTRRRRKGRTVPAESRIVRS